MPIEAVGLALLAWFSFIIGIVGVVYLVGRRGPIRWAIQALRGGRKRCGGVVGKQWVASHPNCRCGGLVGEIGAGKTGPSVEFRISGDSSRLDAAIDSLRAINGARDDARAADDEARLSATSGTATGTGVHITYTRFCGRCGKPFETEHKEVKFCSLHCGVASNKILNDVLSKNATDSVMTEPDEKADGAPVDDAKQGERECVFCGKAIKTVGSFCSITCKNNHAEATCLRNSILAKHHTGGDGGLVLTTASRDVIHKACEMAWRARPGIQMGVLREGEAVQWTHGHDKEPDGADASDKEGKPADKPPTCLACDKRVSAAGLYCSLKCRDKHVAHIAADIINAHDHQYCSVLTPALVSGVLVRDAMDHARRCCKDMEPNPIAVPNGYRVLFRGSRRGDMKATPFAKPACSYCGAAEGEQHKDDCLGAAIVAGNWEPCSVTAEGVERTDTVPKAVSEFFAEVANSKRDNDKRDEDAYRAMSRFVKQCRKTWTDSEISKAIARAGVLCAVKAK